MTIDPQRGTAPKRLGMLVPSSNTVVEPETAKLLPTDGSVTTHVSRGCSPVGRAWRRSTFLATAMVRRITLGGG